MIAHELDALWCGHCYACRVDRVLTIDDFGDFAAEVRQFFARAAAMILARRSARSPR